jgi:hypothetical protein
VFAPSDCSHIITSCCSLSITLLDSSVSVERGRSSEVRPTLCGHAKHTRCPILHEAMLASRPHRARSSKATLQLHDGRGSEHNVIKEAPVAVLIETNLIAAMYL